MSHDIYIAKQPIVNLKNEIFAYELLFRTLDSDGVIKPLIDNEVLATSKVLVNALNHFGMTSLVDDKLAFINISQDFLTDDIIFNIPKELFVLEILEHTKLNDFIISRIKQLKERGYRIALDDAHCNDGFIEYFEPIFPYLDFLKLDVPFIKANTLEPYLEKLRKYDFQILAEKVETKEVFELYKSYGCTLFQGYFFAKPDIVIKKSSDHSSHKIIQLINLISNENTEMKTIVKAFELEIELTIELLRYMNSCYMGVQKEIKSIHHVIMLFGKKPLRQWLLLIASSQNKGGLIDISKNPLLDLAITRSRLMGEIALKTKCSLMDAQEASFIGILSLVDALLHVSLEDILIEISVNDELKEALLNRSGKMGQLLELVIAVEQFDLPKVDGLLSTLHLSHAHLAEVLEKSYAVA